MPRQAFEVNNERKVRTLTLITTRSCNLSCSYCYEKDVKGDSQIMDLDIAKRFITRYLNEDDDFDMVVIDFFGGEPLLGFPFIREVVEWVLSREWPKRYHFALGTNGTLLTDEIKNWMLENKKWVTPSFSINGNKISHDLTRDNSYDLLFPHLSFFMEHWPQQPAKMTICAENLPYVADSIIELEEMAVNFTANVAVEDIWGLPEQEEERLLLYNEQLTRLVDYYENHPELFPPYRILSSLPLSFAVQDNGENHEDCTRFCGAGHEMVLVDVDGQTYPCHRFLPWVTGKPAPTGPVNNQTQWKNDDCQICKISQYCPTCAGFNWEIHNDTGIRSTFHCKATKLEVLASAKLAMRQLRNFKLSNLEAMSPEQQVTLKKRIEIIMELDQHGL